MTAMQTGQRPTGVAAAGPDARPAGGGGNGTAEPQPVDRLDQILPLVARWTGGIGMLWTYTVSYGKLVLRLVKPGVRGNLQLTLYDCRRIAAPALWGNTAVEVAEEQTPDGRRFVLRDPAANVEVRCGYLTAAENVEPIY